jgi:hypothetical protein
MSTPYEVYCLSNEPVLLGVLKEAIVDYAERMAKQHNTFNKTKRISISDFLAQAVGSRKSTTSFTLGLFSAAEVRKDSVANGVFSELVSKLMVELLEESRKTSEAR